MLAALIILFNLASVPVFAWQSDQEGAPAQERHGYPVIVDGYEIFRVHQNLGAASAQERAARISAGLEDLATAEDYDPSLFKTVEEGGVTTIRYGDQLIMTINDAEAHGTGLPRQALARQFASLIQEKLKLAREQHTARYLWHASAYAAATVLIYVIVVWLIVMGTRWMVRTLETSAKAKIKGIKIQQSEIVRGERLTALLVSALKLLRIVVIAILTYIVLAKAFGFFPWTRGQSQRLLGYMVDPLVAIGQALLAYLPNVFYISVVVVVIHFVLRFLRVVAGEVERGRIRFPASIRSGCSLLTKLFDSCCTPLV